MGGGVLGHCNKVVHSHAAYISLHANSCHGCKDTAVVSQPYWSAVLTGVADHNGCLSVGQICSVCQLGSYQSMKA